MDSAVIGFHDIGMKIVPFQDFGDIETESSRPSGLATNLGLVAPLEEFNRSRLSQRGSRPSESTPEFVDGQILKTREICGAVPQTHPGDKESGMTGWKVQLENPTGAGKSGCQKGRSPSSSMEQRVKNGRVAPAFTGRFYDTAARLDDVRSNRKPNRGRAREAR